MFKNPEPSIKALSASYLLMAISSPGISDDLLYLWIAQFGAGTSLMLNYFQVCKLFPGGQGLLIGILNLSSDLCALLPQLWWYLISNEFLVCFLAILR